MSTGVWCAHELALLQQITPEGGVVVEAGANYGAHTLALAKYVGIGGKVVAFEPQRIVFQALCGSIALNCLPNVDVHWAAVGEVSGSIILPDLDYSSENNFGGVSLANRLHPRSHEGQSVRVVTIDSLSLMRCDLIKADVEGMEAHVVRGAADTIQRCRPFLYLECHDNDRRPGLIQLCRGLGYNLYWHGTATDPNMLCVPTEKQISVNGLPSAI